MNDYTPNLCPNGHDKNVYGTRNRMCAECRRQSRRRYFAKATNEQREHIRQAARDRYAAGLPQIRVTKFICPQGHDKRIVGVRKNGTCAECFKIYDTQHRKNATPEERAERRGAHMLHTYKMLPEEYTALAEKQGHRCAICREPERRMRHGQNSNGQPDGLAIDHCHKTNQNRALLCSQCNMGIGNFRDSPDLLIAAANYVRSFDHSDLGSGGASGSGASGGSAAGSSTGVSSCGSSIC